MFKFAEGTWVALKNEYCGLPPGSIGRVWALYNTQPCGYEVTLLAPDGGEFDSMMYEDELVKVGIERQNQLDRERDEHLAKRTSVTAA